MGLMVAINFTVILKANISKVSRKMYLNKLKKRQNSILKERRMALEAIECAGLLNSNLNFGNSLKRADIEKILYKEIEVVNQ